MKNSILAIFTFLFLLGCSDKENDPEMMNEGDCGGDLTLIIDGKPESYGEPEQAFLVFNDFTNAHELGIIWIANGFNVNLQLLLDLGGQNCVETKRFELTNLPTEVSIFSIQYASISKQGSVSNAFFEDGDMGYIEITRCDGSEDVLDIAFGFSGTSVQGEDISLTSGKAENVCFLRTK